MRICERLGALVLTAEHLQRGQDYTFTRTPTVTSHGEEGVLLLRVEDEGVVPESNGGQLGQVHTSLSPTTLTLKGDTRTLMERVGSEHE